MVLLNANVTRFLLQSDLTKHFRGSQQKFGILEYGIGIYGKSDLVMSEITNKKKWQPVYQAPTVCVCLLSSMERGRRVYSWNWHPRTWPGCPGWWWWQTTTGRDGPPRGQWTASLLSSGGNTHTDTHKHKSTYCKHWVSDVLYVCNDTWTSLGRVRNTLCSGAVDRLHNKLADRVWRVISHRVIRVLLLQLLGHVCHGRDGRLQVGREDQTVVVSVWQPLEVHCALTP